MNKDELATLQGDLDNLRSKARDFFSKMPLEHRGPDVPGIMVVAPDCWFAEVPADLKSSHFQIVTAWRSCRDRLKSTGAVLPAREKATLEESISQTERWFELDQMNWNVSDRQDINAQSVEEMISGLQSHVSFLIANAGQ